MQKIILFLKLVLRSKFLLKTPEKHNLIIFDEVSFGDLNICLSKYNYFVLQTRLQNINKIYISFKILTNILKNFFKGNLFTVYLVSLIEVIKPKAVITTMDNSFKFFDVSKILEKKTNFIAIQSASRYDVLEFDYLYNEKKIEKNWIKKFYIPHFLCHGDYEKELYKKLNISVKNISSVGNLRLANALHHIKNNNSYTKYNSDICLIADATNSDLTSIHPISSKIFESGNVKKGYVDLVKFTIKFCIKNKMNLSIPLKRDKKIFLKGHEREINFFKSNFTDEEFDYLQKQLLEKNSKNFTSFRAVLDSQVTVGTSSTLLRDKLGFGGKILACNLTKMDIYDFPINGICTLKNCSYEEFEKRLLEIFSMSHENFLSKIDRKPDYVMKFNKNFSTINLIREKLTQLGVNQTR